MTETFRGDTVSELLPVISQELLRRGKEVRSRNGWTAELLNAQIEIREPAYREVLTDNRKANIYAQIAETMWILAGRNDIEWLSAYLPRAKDYSDDGKVWRGGYGPRIRRWGDPESEGTFVDQLAHVVTLLTEDPLSRQAVIAIYNPEVDTQPGKDIPCNDFLQFQSRLGELHLTVTVRSNDLMWGWSGINAFEWSTLQEIVASLLNVRVGSLVFNIGSLHLYQPHWEKARNLFYNHIPMLPTIPFNPGRNITSVAGLDRELDHWFRWEARCRTGKVDPTQPDGWVDPLFEAWAGVIAYYWTRDHRWLTPVANTRLAVAIARTPGTLLPEPVVGSTSTAPGAQHTQALHERTGAFYHFVSDLHAKKHASYGDSWRKRGELLSILPNMARKVDRLGIGDEFDTSADTLVDLLVYAIKYLNWLEVMPDTPGEINGLLSAALGECEEYEDPEPEITMVRVVDKFNDYCDEVGQTETTEKLRFVKSLIAALAPLARDAWWAEQNSDEYRGADHE